jgi:hypothetical protein
MYMNIYTYVYTCMHSNSDRYDSIYTYVRIGKSKVKRMASFDEGENDKNEESIESSFDSVMKGIFYLYMYMYIF